jgi:hypothetical protein
MHMMHCGRTIKGGRQTFWTPVCRICPHHTMYSSCTVSVRCLVACTYHAQVPCARCMIHVHATWVTTTKFTQQVLKWVQWVQARVVWMTTSLWMSALMSTMSSSTSEQTSDDVVTPSSKNRQVKWVSICYWKHLTLIQCSYMRNAT